MTEELFHKAWLYWSGLFPVFTRSEAAYYHFLRRIPDDDFRIVKERVIGRTDDFPSCRLILDCWEQLGKEKMGEKKAPFSELPLPMETTAKLEERLEKLDKLIAQEIHKGSGFDVNVRRVLERTRSKIESELAKRVDRSSLSFNLPTET